MDSRAKAAETRRHNEEKKRERAEREIAEMKAQLAALRQIRDNREAAPEARLQAIKMIEEMCDNSFGFYDV